MKIGIMGGTFDPIHLGHLQLAKAAYQQYHLDEIWFLPNARPPHKNTAAMESSAADRLEMTRIAIEGDPAFRLIDYEAKKETISYTYQTLDYFHQKYPQNQFFFLIGADSLLTFETWKHPELILKNCTLLVAQREEAGSDLKTQQQMEKLSQKYQTNIFLINRKPLAVSSHQIRELRKQGQPITDLVPAKVEQYILEKKLYE